VDEVRFDERWRRLTGRAAGGAKPTGARFLVDVGDGNHIPIEHAHPAKIREALTALQEKHPKS
jgi:hypothetical protein